MSVQPKTEIGFQDRVERFAETYDQFDTPSVLNALLMAVGDYLARIVGPEAADAAMSAAVQSIAPQEDNWRKTLALNDASAAWALGGQLHQLDAYVEYGILIGVPEDAELGAEIRTLIETAQEFLDRSPIGLWLPAIERPTRLETTIMLARNRWDLDHEEPIEVAALAYFGGVTEGRIRNMLSDRHGPFARADGGKVEPQSALRWLATREAFWPSIWREQALPVDPGRQETPLEAPVFVPVARDGSVFHPGLRRGARGPGESGYTIGEKGAERRVDHFDDALAALQVMASPFWRRPNENGTWGIVRGIRWVRLDRTDLLALEANPGWRLPAEA